MKIRWLVLPMVLIPLLFNLNSNVAASDATVKAPKAVVIEPDFEFKPVPEGTKITHDFIIKNEGTETLEITQVKPG